MKVLSFALIVLFGLSAKANYAIEITSLSRVSYDGTTLNLAYFTGGGCEEHVPALELVLVDPMTIAVKVYDTSEVMDHCEAYISVSGQFNLKERVQAFLNENDMHNWKVNVQLPSMAMSLH